MFRKVEGGWLEAKSIRDIIPITLTALKEFIKNRQKKHTHIQQTHATHWFVRAGWLGGLTDFVD